MTDSPELWSSSTRRRDGRCGCGAVHFRLHGPVRHVVNCHCSICRRWHGHYGAYTAVPSERFELLAGSPRAWASSERLERAFCGECGSSLWARWDGHVSVAAGTLDDTDDLCTVRALYADDAPGYYDVPHPDRLDGTCVLSTLAELPERDMVIAATGERLGRVRDVSESMGLHGLHVWQERLPPGHRASRAHRHSRREELIVVHEGRLTVCHGESKYVVEPGQAVAFQPADATLHTLRNDGDRSVVFLGIATRPRGDVVSWA